MSSSVAIKVENLSKEFSVGSKIPFIKKNRIIKALDNITFEVKQGEVFGLLGKNGAGKTTLIRILLGLIKQSGGEAYIFGDNIREDIMNIRKKTSLLPQEASCYELLTAEENIRYFAGIQGQLSDHEITERTQELINLIGLEDRSKNITKEFSGGMKRKVLVARSLVTNPDLLFLDEPTTGIDILGARVIRNLIKRLSREMNKTIFLTTHDLTDLEELCDRVGIIHEGRIIAIGTPDELEEKFKKSGLEDLFIGLTTGEIDFE